MSTLQQGINDLQTKFPALAKEWHPTLNTITPDQVTYSSSIKDIGNVQNAVLAPMVNGLYLQAEGQLKIMKQVVQLVATIT